jgi:hypothetical protein
MDKEPFLTWNVLEDKLISLDFVKVLQKAEFNQQHSKTFAQENRRRILLVDELTPLLALSPEFVELAVANIENRSLDANVIEEWTPILTLFLVLRAVLLQPGFPLCSNPGCPADADHQYSFDAACKNWKMEPH